MTIHRATLAATLMGAALLAQAVPLKTDLAKSRVSAQYKAMAMPLESNFKRFSAAIDYDGAHPEKSTARVEIDTASLEMDSPDYDKQIAGKEWFNAAQFPKATFVSSAIKPAGPGKLNVTGKLSIKGKTADVSFPLSVKTEGGKQVFEGQLPIKRLAFNIGEGEWKDTSMVADEVLIKFRIAAGQ